MTVEKIMIDVMTEYQTSPIDQQTIDLLTAELKQKIGGEITIIADDSLHVTVSLGGMIYLGIVNSQIVQAVRLPSPVLPVTIPPLVTDHGSFAE